ncbi:hypothetical protein DFJ73DRAFT_836680 [Zopfochytrium polystomum]|nr:hypothetical protein DFJ73DRAFT_836680 [Zopfochytrium polystomum]
MSAIKKWITYHFGGIPTSFKDLAWLIRVNPTWPNHLPAASEFRNVAPGSQTPYVRPFNAKISKNQYFTRDTRRSYPETVVYTSTDISKMISSSSAQQIAAASSSSSTAASSAATESKQTFVPPVINNSYKWKKSLDHIVADEMNPHIHITGRA